MSSVTAPSTQNRPGLAIGLKIAAVFLFMVMGAMVKIVTEEVPPGEAVFFRAFCALPVILVWIWSRGELRYGLIPNSLRSHVWRALFGTTAMGMTFFGLSMLPLPEVTAIGYASPLFAVVFAALILGERVRVFRISAVLVGLIGVLIVIWPRLTLDSSDVDVMASVAALMVLTAAILRALVQVHIRTMVKTEHTAAIVFYFSASASVLALATAPFGWVWPSTPTLILLVCSGLVGGVAQILITSSYRYGAASMLAPFDYVSMIFAALIGYVVFSELPAREIWMGSALVIVGGALIIWRERQLGMERGKARGLVDPKG